MYKYPESNIFKQVVFVQVGRVDLGHQPPKKWEKRLHLKDFEKCKQYF